MRLVGWQFDWNSEDYFVHPGFDGYRAGKSPVFVKAHTRLLGEDFSLDVVDFQFFVPFVLNLDQAEKAVGLYRIWLDWLFSQRI